QAFQPDGGASDSSSQPGKADLRQLDGVNLLPFLEGRDKTLDRDALYWRFGVQYAVRQGDWKLVKASKDMTPMLVNLAKDRGETNDVSQKHPERVKALL